MLILRFLEALAVLLDVVHNPYYARISRNYLSPLKNSMNNEQPEMAHYL